SPSFFRLAWAAAADRPAQVVRMRKSRRDCLRISFMAYLSTWYCEDTATRYSACSARPSGSDASTELTAPTIDARSSSDIVPARRRGLSLSTRLSGLGERS